MSMLNSLSIIRLLSLLPICALPLGCATPHLVDDGVMVRGQDDDEGIGIGKNTGKDWLDRISGRGAAANVPVANKLPWIGAGKEKNEIEARSLFAQAEAAFAERKYGKAQKLYGEAAKLFPKSQLEEDALFMVAESQFFADEYGDAFESYEKLMARYKGTRHLDAVAAREFAIGRFWIGMEMKDPSWRLLPNWTDEKRPFLDTQGKALRAFEKVRLNHPTGPLADDSIMATAGWYFAEERYTDADYFYTLLRREYPSSEHQYEAHYLGIQAKIRSYQGPDYDGTKMVEAKKLIEQTLKQFTDATPEDRQRLNDLYAKVNRALAERDYDLGQYYESRGYNTAASMYYGRLAQEFPETQLATQARQRVAKLQGKPAAPEPKLTWISALFPDKNEQVLKLDPRMPPNPGLYNGPQDAQFGTASSQSSSGPVQPSGYNGSNY